MNITIRALKMAPRVDGGETDGSFFAVLPGAETSVEITADGIEDSGILTTVLAHTFETAAALRHLATGELQAEGEWVSVDEPTPMPGVTPDWQPERPNPGTDADAKVGIDIEAVADAIKHGPKLSRYEREFLTTVITSHSIDRS
jgi:hypothetical protein